MKIFAFDLDGTFLITAETKHSSALRAIAKRFRVIIDPLKIWKRKREGLSNLKLLLEYGVNEKDANDICLTWQKEIENPFWLSLDVLIQDSVLCLSRVRKIAATCTLVTAEHNEFLVIQQLLLLSEHFLSVYCANPKNSVVEKSKILMKISASVFFGDTETDFEVANLVKVPFFTVSTRQRSEMFLNKYRMFNVSASLFDALTKATQGVIE